MNYTAPDPTEEQLAKRLAFSRKMGSLWVWRNRLQWIGGSIMVPAVILGVVMNFGWVPISWAEYLLWAIGIAIVILVGSMTCTITYNKIKDADYKSSMAAYHADKLAKESEQTPE